MKTTRRSASRKLLLWSLMAAGAVIVACWITAAPSYQECVAGHERSDASQKALAEAAIFFRCEGVTIGENDTLAVALLTGVLAVSTIFLWLETRRLARGAETQSEDTRALAAATEKFAEATIKVELPVILFSKPELLVMRDRTTIVASDMRDRAGGPITVELLSHFSRVQAFKTKNAGRTPAFPKKLSIGWECGKQLPSEPVYQCETRSAPNMVLEPTAEYRPAIDPHCIELSDDALAAVLDGDMHFWLFGCLYYDDFMSEGHEARFCWIWEPIPGHADPDFHFVRDRNAPANYTRNF
jgi:hypothetical protein